MAAKEKFDQQLVSKTLMGCVQEAFRTMAYLEFEDQPEFEKKEIIEYNSRMRAFGLDKFDGPCYVSAVYFYLNEKDHAAKRANGALAIFIEESVVQKLIHALGHRGVDEEDKTIALDTCGKFAAQVAAQFRTELRNFGYIDIVAAAPKTYVNDVPEGLDFNFDEVKYYELSFYLKKEKALVVNITMGPVPLRS